MSRNQQIGILVALAIVVLAGGFLLLQNNARQNLPTPTATPTTQASPDTEANATTSASPSQQNDYENYTFAQGNWQIDYWTKLNITQKDASELGPDNVGIPLVNFVVLGKTQVEGTEFYDGLSFNVGIIEKPTGQTLKDFADKRTSSTDPNLPSKRVYFKAVDINGLSGYDTYVEAFGNFRTIFLPHVDSDKAYEITIISEGSEKKMYDEVSEKMLQSFKIL